MISFQGEIDTRVERYGKKYSWIAFYEIAGIRDDQGLLNYHGRFHTRISDVDIDPTFPEKENNLKLLLRIFYILAELIY